MPKLKIVEIEPHYEVVVVGAGPTGLSLSCWLKKLGLHNHLVIDEKDTAGSSFKETWDHFQLAMPASQLKMPGLSLDVPEHYHLKRDELVSMLQKYAEQNALPIQYKTRLFKIKKRSEDYQIDTSQGSISAKNLVICVGPRQELKLPAFFAQIPNSIKATDYKNPLSLAEKPVQILIVGSGLSALSIALDIKQHTPHTVSLACGYSDQEIEQKNRHVFFSPNPFIKGLLPSQLKKEGIKLLSRLKDAKEGFLYFVSDRPRPIHEFHKIIFATGYHDHSFSFLPKEYQLKAVAGLYFAGPRKGKSTQDISESASEAEEIAKEIHRSISPRPRL